MVTRRLLLFVWQKGRALFLSDARTGEHEHRALQKGRTDPGENAKRENAKRYQIVFSQELFPATDTLKNN